MLRLIFLLLIFGAAAVLGLLYFDLIALTPQGESMVDDAERAIENAVDAAEDAIDDVTGPQ